MKDEIKEIATKEVNKSSEKERSPKSSQKRIMKIQNDKYEFTKPSEILINTAEWLIKKGKLNEENCTVPSGPRGYIVNKEPKHRNGNEFYNPKKLSNGTYLETLSKSIESSRKLLKHCGYSKDILKIE